MIKKILRKLFSIYVRFIPYGLLIYMYFLTNRLNNKDKNKITALALTPNRFRGDLNSLVSTGKYNILSINIEWLQKLFNAFYGDIKVPNFFHLNDELHLNRRKEYRGALNRDLAIYAKIFDIDILLSAAVYYRWEYDIGAIFQIKCGPWIAFHRENLFASDGFYNFAIDLYSDKGVWAGSSIVVHNEIAKKIMIDSGLSTKNNVHSLGALRMDGFIQRLSNYTSREIHNKSIKKVLMFSFTPGSTLYGYDTDPKNLNVTNMFWPDSTEKGMWNLYKYAHKDAIIASSEAGFDLIIRPKWTGIWVKNLQEMILSIKNEGYDVSRVHIDTDSDAHDLIFNSNCVIGFASTAILEAGLRKIPVIIPNFYEANERKYSDYIILKGEYGAFEIANTRHEYKKMIVNYLDNYLLDEQKYKMRINSFNKWVSSTTCNAIDKYTKLLHDDLVSWRSENKIH